MTAPPISHLVDAQQLQGDGPVELFTIQLLNGSVLRLKNNNTVTYQGQTYEGLALQLTGTARDAGTETVRPQLTIANPEGAFSGPIDTGQMDRAVLIKWRVLYVNLIANNPIYEEKSWVISRVLTLNKHVATFEMRGQGDSQFFVTPARMFMPPDFPQVSLQ